MVGAAERAFVIKLGPVGPPELLPGLQQMLTSGRCRFSGMRGGVGIVAIDVDGVEGLHHVAPVIQRVMMSVGWTASGEVDRDAGDRHDGMALAVGS